MLSVDDAPMVRDMQTQILRQQPMKTDTETTIRLSSALKHNRAAEVGFHRSVDQALRTLASSDDGIKELLSKIERKLPNVTEASEDLQALRGLFELQLVGASSLLKYTLECFE